MGCDLSVIIATYKRPDMLKWCLEGIASDCSGLSWECLVVGQGDDTTTQQVLETQFADEPEIRYLYSERAGASVAREFGSRRAKGRVLAFLDDDASPATGWAKAVLEALPAGDDEFGMACGQLLPKWEGRRPSWYPRQREFLLGLYRDGDDLHPLKEGDLPIGANMAIRRDVFERIGGFDVEIGFSPERSHSLETGEDSLLGIRTKQAGFGILYHPRMVVHHHVRQSKLALSYFLRRHFWEGVTATTMLERSMRVERNTWLVMMGQEACRFFWKCLRVLVPFGSGEETFLAAMGFFSAEASYASGRSFGALQKFRASARRA